MCIRDRYKIDLKGMQADSCKYEFVLDNLFFANIDGPEDVYKRQVAFSRVTCIFCMRLAMATCSLGIRPAYSCHCLLYTSVIEKAGKGVIVYLNQEGRGIGLMEKMRAYKIGRAHV